MGIDLKSFFKQFKSVRDEFDTFGGVENINFDYPRHIDFAAFLEDFNDANNCTKKNLEYHKAEAFIASIGPAHGSTFAEKVMVTIKVYTDLIETRGVENYAKSCTEFLGLLKKWAATRLETLNNMEKEMKSQSPRRRRKKDNKYEYHEVEKFKLMEAKISAVRVITITDDYLLAAPPKYHLSEFVEKQIKFHLAKKNSKNRTLKRPAEPEVGVTKRVESISEKPIKRIFTEREKLEIAIDSEDKQLLENLDKLTALQTVVLIEFLDDIYFGVIAAFTKLEDKPAKSTVSDEYKRFCCFLVQLFGVSGPPLVDFALYYLRYTGVLKQVNLESFGFDEYSSKPLSLQVISKINDHSPNNFFIYRVVEKVMSLPSFSDFLTKKLVWIQRHSFYYTKLCELDGSCPRFEERQLTRMLVQHKIITSINWQGKADL